MEYGQYFRAKGNIKFMSDYTSPKAAGRDLSQPKTPPLKGGESNQTQLTGAGIKSGPMPSASDGSTFMSGTQREFSNQLQFGANAKGTGQMKNALRAYKQKIVGTPPTGDMSGNRKAAGRTNGVNL